MDTPTLSDPFTAKTPGKLTIFASYFPGTGKSHAMLEAARTAKQEGLDVVVGLLSCDRWPSVGKLAEGLEAVRCKTVTQEGRIESELDLDACIKRRPQLILIEDLSHTNIDGSRHRKRCQDIEELLKAGIDVYTTLDVQHIESIQDTVLSIRGTPKFCVKSNECRNRANLYVGGSGLTVCRLCLQHNAGGDGCQGR